MYNGRNYCVFASSYLHSCEPAIIHGNLTCDTIFIQHNGLIKIGSGGPLSSLESCRASRSYDQRNNPNRSTAHPYSHSLLSVFRFPLLVAPDTINNHVKTCREEQKSLHFFAPEYGGKILPSSRLTSGIFLFSFSEFPFLCFQLLPVLPQRWIYIPLECAP